MTKRDKLIKKLSASSSDKNWTLAEVETLLSIFGFSNKGGKGSHRAYKNPTRTEIIVLAPHGSQIKPIYIKEIRSILLP